LAQNGGVDADDVAGRIEQGTAAVSEVDGGIGLDQAFEFLIVLAANGTAERTHHSGG
jgi:hypothetical protein